MTVQPFTIKVAQPVLDDLQDRLARTRWPVPIDGVGWDYGMDIDVLKGLVDYWQHSYDWRAQEAKLNQFPQFRAEIDGIGLHFIHVRGKGPNPTPLLMLHGWPDSFYRMLKLIPLLTESADSFDVIVPSLPGFGFSDRPNNDDLRSSKTVELLVKLMTDELGYQRFGVMGGDIGGQVARLMSLRHPDRIIGMHLTDIGYQGDNTFPTEIPNPTEAEQPFLDSIGYWFMQEGAYAAFHSTKPQTLAFSLNTSPVGLAAWIIEKFHTWSDGGLDRSYTKDELLTNVMIYWVTQTIGSSIRLYLEDGKIGPQLNAGQYIEVPAGVATFPKDLTLPPREVGERFLRLQRWTVMPRGGHFAALEEPALLADDLHAFFRPLR
jgi:microsomal epoxide hydrolase